MNPGWTEWSEWAWDGARYWRARQDAQGNVEYDFSTPRGGNVDDLADSINNVNLGSHEDPAYTHGDEYTHGAPMAADGSATASGYGVSYAQSQYAQSQYAQPQSAYLAKGKPKPKGNHKEGHRDKGQSRKSRPKPAKNFDDDSPEGLAADEHDPFYRRRGGAAPEPVPVSNAAYAAQQGYPEPTYGAPSQDATYAPSLPQAADADSRYGQESSTYPSAEPQPTSPGQYGRHDYGSGSGSGLSGSVAEDESTYPEHHGHRGYAAGAGDRVPESAAAEDPPPEEQGSEHYSTTSDELPPDIQDALSSYMTGSVDDHTTGESSSMASAYTYEPPTYEAEGRETPRPHAQPATTPGYYQNPGGAVGSVGTGGESDINIVSGVVEPSSKFRPGEVFKIMWCEPRGGGPPNRSEIITQRMRVDHGSGSIYQGLRRFIVVANDEGHCTCVPILTYERQGCNKRGVKALKHGIVYQNGKRPRMLQGEPELGFEAVRVNLTERAEQLVKESRVNYAKLTTIEHNFPVLFIGRVEPADFRNIVRPAVDICWQRKRH